MRATTAGDRRVLVIGIGAGDPEYVTVQAIRALNDADVLFVMDKGADRDDLVALRRQICDRFVEGPYRLVSTPDAPRDLAGPSYRDDVQAWHDTRAAAFARLLADEVPEGGVGAFLVWGDPALYDSTLRVLDQVAATGAVAFTVEVVPGISAVQALAARHRIPLHRVGAPVHITTGRRLAEGWPPGVDDVVVMLDGSCAFRSLDPGGLTIHWGAYLGTPDEILVAGPLAEVADEIVRVRAVARARKGWMFDTYLLSRATEA
jgi:precorrin-6A synthase